MRLLPRVLQSQTHTRLQVSVIYIKPDVKGIVFSRWYRSYTLGLSGIRTEAKLSGFIFKALGMYFHTFIGKYPVPGWTSPQPASGSFRWQTVRSLTLNYTWLQVGF
jgi:hypothetical protein